MRGIAKEVFIGAVAGAVGTAAMTTLMEPGLAGRLSTRWRPAEFVPKQIVRWAESLLNVQHLLSEEQEMVAAGIAHLGYGSTMGALYGILREKGGGMPAPLLGGVWGLVVWAIGYEVWMPAAGIRPATTDFPPTRWPSPILNHLIYGTVTANAFERLRGAAGVRTFGDRSGPHGMRSDEKLGHASPAPIPVFFRRRQVRDA